MSKKEIVEYFNSISGKTVDLNKVKQKLEKINPQTSKQVFNAIYGSEFKHQGAFKYCTFFGDRKVFAMLKSKSSFVKQTQQRVNKQTAEKINLNRKLIKNGVRTPKIYSMFFSDHKFIEIQQRAIGKPMYIFSLEYFIDKYPKIYTLFNYFYNLTIKEQKFISQKLFNYTVNQQKILLELSQEKYDKFLNNYIILNKMGIPFNDNHPENIMLSKNGFTFIDINYDYMFEPHEKQQQVKSISEKQQALNFLEPFGYSSFFAEYLTENQNDVIRKNNIGILRKAVTSVSSNGINIIENSDAKRLFRRCLGDNLMSQNLDYILISQNNLHQNKK